MKTYLTTSQLGGIALDAEQNSQFLDYTLEQYERGLITHEVFMRYLRTLNDDLYSFAGFVADYHLEAEADEDTAPEIPMEDYDTFDEVRQAELDAAILEEARRIQAQGLPEDSHRTHMEAVILSETLGDPFDSHG